MSKTIAFFYKKLIEPKSENEDLKRREFILNILLTAAIFLFGLGFTVALYQSITLPEYVAISPIILLAIFFIFLILYLVSRAGFFILSAYLFIGVFLISTTYAIYRWGIELPSGLLFYVLIIVMSGILISTRFAFLITGIASLTIAIINYLRVNHLISPDLYWKTETWGGPDIIALVLIFGIIATVSWLSNREIERSLKRARGSEAELKKERDMLEVKVEERTKELRKLKMEKMSKLYRFAELGRLSSGLFHDLINPLTAISLNLEKVNLGRGGSAELTEMLDVKPHLEQAMSATKRMEDFIIAMRKQIAPTVAREPKTLFSLNQEIKAAVQIFSYRAQKANIEINFLLNENIRIYGDAIKFNQIITNLIDNAIDAYTEPRGEINPEERKRELEVRLGEKGDFVYLTVEDWGCGISKEAASKIFQPYFTTKGSQGGIGIGLPLIKNIIEKDFKGSIGVESEENKGTKFIIKFPKNIRAKNRTIKINKTMNNYFQYLINHQQEDGSFLDSKGTKSVLSTALILSCLNNLKETVELKEIKQKAANFLLSQKDNDWLFSENIGADFCALSALMKYNPEIIDGRAIAKILMVLTSVETKEGGPYYSYFGKEKERTPKRVDLGVNSEVAYFLSLQNVELPELNNLIEAAIESGDFKSEFWTSDYPVIYLISKFYKGGKKQKMIDFILSREESGKWEDPLNTALAASSLLNLNYPVEKLEKEMNYLKNCDIGSFTLDIAFYLETLDRVDSAGRAEKPAFDRKFTADEEKIYNLIIKIAQQRFSSLSGKIKDYAMEEIKKVIKGNPDKQMTFMSYYFKKALGKKGERISTEMVAKLGLANIFFWTAFIIYDDFIDEEGDPKIISTANLYARDFTTLFNTLFSPKSDFNRFFRKLMDKLDEANTWEAVNCRAKVNGTKIEIPQNIPDYGNYEVAYQPASAHILGPVEMLFYLGYKENSPEVQNLISYFKNYLIAMQLNDDMHDWEEDLRRGHLSTVVVMLLKDYKEAKPDKREIDMEKDLAELQKIFWFKTIVKAAEITVQHTEKSRQALESMTILEDLSPLERFIEITEGAAKKALREQKATSDFLKTYQT